MGAGAPQPHDLGGGRVQRPQARDRAHELLERGPEVAGRRGGRHRGSEQPAERRVHPGPQVQHVERLDGGERVGAEYAERRGPLRAGHGADVDHELLGEAHDRIVGGHARVGREGHVGGVGAEAGPHHGREQAEPRVRDLRGKAGEHGAPAGDRVRGEGGEVGGRVHAGDRRPAGRAPAGARAGTVPPLWSCGS